MKKLYTTIIAAWVATAAIPALAVDTSMWGVLREYVETDNITGGPVDSKPGVKLTNFISVFGIKVVEPLNDIQPGAKLELNVVTDFFSDDPNNNWNTGSVPADRRTRIGNQRTTVGFLTDKYGIEAGYNAHAVWKALRENIPLGDLEAAFPGEIHSRQKLRFSNAIFTWVKPIDGVKISYEHAFSETQDRGDGQAIAGEVDVTKDIKIRGTYYTEGYVATGYTKENTSKIFNATWQVLSGTKLWLTRSDDTFSDKESTGTSVYVSQQINPKWLVAAGYGWRDTDNVQAFNIGANYIVNNSITLHVRALKATSSNPITWGSANDLAGVVGTDRTNVALGLEFKF